MSRAANWAAAAGTRQATTLSLERPPIRTVDVGDVKCQADSKGRKAQDVWMKEGQTAACMLSHNDTHRTLQAIMLGTQTYPALVHPAG